MHYQVEILNSNEVKSDKFSLHCRYDWLKAFEEISNLKVKYIICTYKNNIQAYLPVFLDKKFNSLEVKQPVLSYYSAIQFDFPSKKRRIDNIKKRERIIKSFAAFFRKKFSYVNLNLLPEINDLRGFKKFSFDITPYYTFLIDLNEMDYSNFTKTTKREIRLSRELDLNIEESIDLENLIKLTFKTYKRNNNTFYYDKGRFRTLLSILNENNLFKQYNLFHKDRLIANHAVLPDSKKLFGFLSATETEYLGKGVNTYLTYNLLKDCSKKHDLFDYCGANMEKIAHYKAGFNPKLEMFFNIKFMNNNLMNMMRKVLKR